MASSKLQRLIFPITVVVLFTGLSILSAQSRFIGRKVIAVVPMIGSGSADDPFRPRFVPGPKDREAVESLDYQFVTSDDGKWAIVIFRVTQPSEAALKLLDRIEGTKGDGVVAFDAGKSKKSDMEAEIKKRKANFDLDDFLGYAEPKEKK